MRTGSYPPLGAFSEGKLITRRALRAKTSKTRKTPKDFLRVLDPLRFLPAVVGSVYVDGDSTGAGSNVSSFWFPLSSVVGSLRPTLSAR